MSIAVDIIIIVLLTATCGYCIYISKRLDAVRSSHIELREAIAIFDKASVIAQANIERMENMSVRRDVGSEESLAKGEAMIDELSIMVSAGERIAERIENAMKGVRTIGKRRTKNGLKKAA